MNTFSLNKQIQSLILTSVIAFTAAGTSAFATSPVHPSGLNQMNIQSSSYTAVTYQAEEASKMFPQPTEGMVQHILNLPELENEAQYRIEILIGRTELVDCNKHGLRGELKQMNLDGWGYNYYQVDSISDGPSTMMACFDKAKTEQFLTIPGELMLKYDSRLPKVFYLPEGAQLKYRVWTAKMEYQFTPSN
ncbi:serine protease inhibitor ecotin [Shewanella colwelliana]|uniref:serine protease inhibitor ecotin n=1 Tax=Shewanella colwelliana TaxID=23 RepID=UPI0022AFB027|nr:serine protease inhibitor ecotin [Shewanella colwelliana]MCZ4339816.1 serine protease inhibitor ecotin [Shewanella colwelliana]